ncbi:hypothetical protein [Gracilimonas sp.]|uniref:hypothetical protein n=1 Tax=Gracilimonas sp. TaxID=1974203 RepID=UPI0028721B43|nr:hypothetical protein [Gracilimonas sp.]
MKTECFAQHKMHKIISLLITFVGVALLTFMIVVEDEPGAIPLALIVTGLGWYIFTRIKSNHRRV